MVHTHLALFIYYVSQFTFIPLLLLLFVLSLVMMLIFFLSSFCLVFYPYSIYIQVCQSIVLVFHK